MNDLWYPEFGLRENPFSSYEFTYDTSSGINCYVKTLAIDRICTYARSGSSVFFVGAKGSGKSVAIHMASVELYSQKLILSFVAPKTFADVYNSIWDEFVGLEGQDQGEHYDDVNTYLSDRHSDDIAAWSGKKRCAYFDCRKRDKCRILNGKSGNITINLFMENIFRIQNNCPMKRRIIEEMLEDLRGKLKGYVYLLDVPDDFIDGGKYTKIVMERLVAALQKSGTVIVTCTSEQYKVIAKSESLARYPNVDFPLPTKENLKQMYVERVSAFRKNERTEENHLFPFSNQALEYLIDVSEGVPREFIFKCGEVLVKMQREDALNPADLSFVVSALGFGTMISETDAINSMLAELRAKVRVWVKTKEMVKLLMQKGVTVTSKRLGRRLKNEWKLERRYCSDSEYKVSP